MFGFFLAANLLSAPQKPVFTPESVLKAIERRESFGSQLSDLERWFGGENALTKGSDVKLDELTAVWAIRLPAGAKSATVEFEPWNPEDYLLGPVPLDPNRLSFKPVMLRAVGNAGLMVGGRRYADADACRWRYAIDGKAVGGFHDLEAYSSPPESKPIAGVPQGKLEQQPQLTSQIFNGTRHDWWIYTSANFDPKKDSSLIIFQDGQFYKNYVPTYLDNMIAHGELQQTVAVFVTPGTFPDGKSDRSREYDTLDEAYVRFLLEEVLPKVAEGRTLSSDPKRRCIAGISSGGICSFTAAWERPDQFGLVLSWVGSFTNIASGNTLREGGHNYPALIRKTPKKAIRVFLQDGAHDLDNVHGNWPLGNHSMAKALRFAGYDLKTVWGNGFHSDKQGRATLADALRWLFRP